MTKKDKLILEKIKLLEKLKKIDKEIELLLEIENPSCEIA